MNNLHRELAPISDAAWADIEDEARRTFTRHVAARRVVDVIGPAGEQAVGGRYRPPARARVAGTRGARPAPRRQPGRRVPGAFAIDRQAVDDVERGAKDSDWQPVKDAAKEHRLRRGPGRLRRIRAAGIAGIRASLVQPVARAARGRPRVPDRRRAGAHLAAARRRRRPLQPAAVGRRLHRGRRDRPTTATRSASTSPGCIGDGEIIWAPAIDGALPALHPRRRLRAAPRAGPVDRLPRRTTPTTIELYFQESLTFIVHTTEAAVSLV